MGCMASRERAEPVLESTSFASTDETALTDIALRFGQQFELTTPMLVMPFGVFKAQGRIMKSIGFSLPPCAGLWCVPALRVPLVHSQI